MTDMYETRAAVRELMLLRMEQMQITRRQLAWTVNVSEGLVRILMEDPESCTHPNIAARILGVLHIYDKKALKCLTAKKRWGDLPRIPRSRKEWTTNTTETEPMGAVNWAAVEKLAACRQSSLTRLGRDMYDCEWRLHSYKKRGALMPMDEIERLAGQLGVEKGRIMA